MFASLPYGTLAYELHMEQLQRPLSAEQMDGFIWIVIY